jgi:hypothetical protein
MLCKLILGHSGMAAKAQNVAMVTAAKSGAIKLIGSIHSRAPTDYINLPHK